MSQPVLVVTDVQERLFGAMDAERRDEMVRNLKILLTAARRLGTPILVTEQYPRGLGRTLPELRVLLDDSTANPNPRVMGSMARRRLTVVGKLGS